MQHVQKLLPALLMLVAGFGLQGCSDFEQGAVVGGVVGGIVGSHYGHDHYHGGYYRRGYYHCRGYYCTEGVASVQGAAPKGDVAVVAQKYDLPVGSAKILVNALHQAKARNFSALEKMGLLKQDFIAIYNNQNPSATALQKMSSALQLDVGATHDLIQDIKMDIAEGRANGSIPNY